MAAASSARRSGRVGAWSKELPGVAILKLSPVFAPLFSFRDRCLVNFSNIPAPPFNCGWPKLGSNFRLDGQIWPNVRSAPHAVPSPKVVTREDCSRQIAGQKYCSVPDPAHRRLAEDVRFPVTSWVQKDPTHLMPFPPVNLSNGLEIKHNSNPSY